MSYGMGRMRGETIKPGIYFCRVQREDYSAESRIIKIEAQGAISIGKVTA